METTPTLAGVLANSGQITTLLGPWLGVGLAVVAGVSILWVGYRIVKRGFGR